MKFKGIAFLTIIVLLLNNQITKAQNISDTIKGYVYDDQGNPIEDASVIVEGINLSTTTQSNGYYLILLPEEKNYKVHFSKVKYLSIYKRLHKKQHAILENIILKRDKKIADLEDVSVAANTAITTLRQSAYNVVAIDAKPYYNTTMDLAQLLDRASGVKVRSSGGVGSDYNVSLNGFSGRHVKVFIDGMPMEGMGSAFQLNNIPVNIAERIEVYKGVVPIEFGSDAIGGVINIVTKKGKRTHLDVSASYRSFNTYKSNIDYGITTKKGFTFNINAFQNYSDNNYKVWMEEIKNVNTNVYMQDPQWVKRFHDNYHNETVVTNFGFVNKKWADRLLVGVTLGQEKADIQHAYIMKIVYGQRFRKGNTIMPNLIYQKNNLFTRGLNLKLAANYSKNHNQNIDTSARSYNWLGEWARKATQGEGGTSTLAKFNNHNLSSTGNLTYHLGTQHTFSINDVYNSFNRKNDDAASVITDGSQSAQYLERKNSKNILGASYKWDYNKRWNTSVFAKNYSMSVTSPVNVATNVNEYNYANQSKSQSVMGYGIATTYFIKEYLQLKASYEKAARLPTDNELFGDQVLQTENTSLRPERSHNINLGITYNKEIVKNHSIYADLGLMYRHVYDYIRQIVEQRYGTQSSINWGKVQNMGINAEVRYFYKDILAIGGTVTYQNLRNKDRETSANNTSPNAIYNDRLPNVPYFFGNTDVSVFLKDIWHKGNTMSIMYSTQYVHAFYLQWPSLGEASTKFTIPEQFSHDILLSYAMKGGKYNVGLEGRNLTNRKLYDNWSLQKPGRNFSIKLRYYLMR
ncbi:TonB-dependent receptor domain-containing protein [Rhizosphaericola mali]|uniref:TonB-dependent receptor plug domain-containing protein n=1 Tax=Rhizosphaericola mali TaxID=2545455 RepID=A0A5P2G8P8_9BACT|nr:TonB-dependent receptor [Rhizosphaericola mali]QES90302.1 TonB-dependent receptor plug domain-containing protein [Rhizosphaericola mali]